MSDSLLSLARRGDDRAFGDLVGPYRRELHLHCYRLTGSVVDAEDALQETLLSAWRGLNGFAERASVRTWLYRIATNRCLNAIRDDRYRRTAEPLPPFDPPPPTHRAEAVWLQPYPDALLGSDAEARYARRETVELAFVAALQRIPPRQVAVLLLRDVLEFSTSEVADMLSASPTAVKGVLQRARETLGAAAPGVRRRPGSDRDAEVAQRFATAFTGDDIAGVVALLTDDAWLAMPPAPHEYHGREAIGRFLQASADWRAGRRFTLVPTRANRQPAYGFYLATPDGDRAVPAGVLVLDVDGGRIRAVTRFLDPALPGLFDLPATLADVASLSPAGRDRASGRDR